MNKIAFAITFLGINTLAEDEITTFCDYPMWSIPKTGTESRCDWEECPMRPEEACDSMYGVFGGDQCKVFCANND